MNNPPYRYWPIVGRPEISWPEGRSFAFYVALNIESFVPGVPSTGLAPPFALPMDPMNQGWRDYGTRVGIWRMIDLLDAHDLRASVLLNSDVCKAFPQIIRAGMDRNWAWLGHGVTNSRKWTDLDRTEEGMMLDMIVEELSGATGSQPRGWLGPALTETPNTLPLLAERGFTYTLDWAADDQPYPMDVAGHRFISIPYATEINDISAYLLWNWTPEQFAQAIMDQFVTLREEAKSRSGLVMALSLHPFLSNTPFRNGYLDKALDFIRAHDDVWFPTTDEISEHYLAHHFDAAVTAIDTMS